MFLDDINVGSECCTLLEGFGGSCLYLLIVYHFIVLVWISSWQSKFKSGLDFLKVMVLILVMLSIWKCMERSHGFIFHMISIGVFFFFVWFNSRSN